MATKWKNYNQKSLRNLQAEKLNWRVLRYCMFTKWKNVNRELCYISCSRSGKFQLGNSTVFHVHEVEKFNWRTYEITCPRSGKFWVWNSTVFHVQEVEMFSQKNQENIFSTNWKTFNWEICSHFVSVTLKIGISLI